MIMKRFTAYIAAIFGTTAIICSCTKAEESGSEVKGEEHKISFAVDGTRTDYELSGDGSVKVDWQNGDVIYVATSDGSWGNGYSTEDVKPKIFTYNAGSGLFEGDATLAAGEYTFRAQYAAESQRTYVLSKSASNRLLASQRQTGAGMSHVKEYDCMVAERTSTISGTSNVPTLSMKHLYSFVKITIKNETQSTVVPNTVKFKVGGKALNGIFTIDDLKNAIISTKSSNTDTAQLSLDGISIAAGASFDAYMVVAPFTGFTGDIEIDVYTASDNYKLVKPMSGFSIERAKLYSTEIALNTGTNTKTEATYTLIGSVADMEAGKYLMAGYSNRNSQYNFWTGRFGNNGTWTSGNMHTVPCTYNASTGTLSGAEDAVEIELVPVSGIENAYYISYNSQYVYSVVSGSYKNLALGSSANYYWTFTDAASGGVTGTDNSSGLIIVSANTADTGVIRAYTPPYSYGIFFFKKNTSGQGGGDDPNQDTSKPAIDGRTGWAELPEYKAGADYIYHLHSAADGSGQIRRNYSMCFDKSKRASHWIAYPLHSCYRGSLSREDNFGYDPDIAEAYQAYMGSSYVGNYDRGHQLPNADRTCSREMADQTFYSTNMTPQASQFNQQGWATLEGRLRDSYMCADTLYVVTGAHFGTDWDSSIAPSTTDREGKVCPTPTHYYKVLLRTKSGRTGKSVTNCAASELQCVCFLYKHVSSFSSVTATDLCSVTDIEELTGFTFFTNVPNAPKDSFSVSDWGF